MYMVGMLLYIQLVLLKTTRGTPHPEAALSCHPLVHPRSFIQRITVVYDGDPSHMGNRLHRLFRTHGAH